jgi:peptidoglycan/LPS O-acetylase OafA/YrhL
VGRALRWRPVAWIGVVSYGIYLWHYDLLLDLAPDLWAGGRALAAAGAVLVLGLSVAAGFLSYVLLERPALALARRDRDERPTPPAGPPPADSPSAGSAAVSS